MSLGLTTNHKVTPNLHFVSEPSQQAYIFLAAAATRDVANEYRSFLRALAQTSLNRSGVVSVGALGVPIHRYWALAAGFLDPEVDINGMRPHLAAIAARYAETMELARANRYLWENCAAPVDVGDIDIAGITALLVDRLGDDRFTSIVESLPGLDAVGRALMAVGAELAIDRQGSNQPHGPPSEPEPDPPDVTKVQPRAASRRPRALRPSRLELKSVDVGWRLVAGVDPVQPQYSWMDVPSEIREALGQLISARFSVHPDGEPGSSTSAVVSVDLFGEVPGRLVVVDASGAEYPMVASTEAAVARVPLASAKATRTPDGLPTYGLTLGLIWYPDIEA
jgi:hypothetical protein